MKEQMHNNKISFIMHYSTPYFGRRSGRNVALNNAR